MLFRFAIGIRFFAKGENFPEDDAVAPDIRFQGESVIFEILGGDPLPTDTFSLLFQIPKRNCRGFLQFVVPGTKIQNRRSTGQ